MIELNIEFGDVIIFFFHDDLFYLDKSREFSSSLEFNNGILYLYLMKKVLIFFILISAGAVSAQIADPSFLQFRNNSLSKSFKPVFALSGPSFLARTEYNFRL